MDCYGVLERLLLSFVEFYTCGWLTMTLQLRCVLVEGYVIAYFTATLTNKSIHSSRVAPQIHEIQTSMSLSRNDISLTLPSKECSISDFRTGSIRRPVLSPSVTKQRAVVSQDFSTRAHHILRSPLGLYGLLRAPVKWAYETTAGWLAYPSSSLAPTFACMPSTTPHIAQLPPQLVHR